MEAQVIPKGTNSDKNSMNECEIPADINEVFKNIPNINLKYIVSEKVNFNHALEELESVKQRK